MVMGMFPIGGQNSWKLASESFTIYFDEMFYIDNGYIRLNDSYLPTKYNEFSFEMKSLSGIFDGMFDADSSPYETEIVKEIAGSLAYDVYGRAAANLQLFYRTMFNYLQICFLVNLKSRGECCLCGMLSYLTKILFVKPLDIDLLRVVLKNL